jgi:hypothetical protein
MTGSVPVYWVQDRVDHTAVVVDVVAAAAAVVVVAAVAGAQRGIGDSARRMGC